MRAPEIWYNFWADKGETPPVYMHPINKSTCSVKTLDWQGSHINRVSLGDVLCYFNRDAHNISSGMRSLGAINGDWRNIDELASEVLQYFKIVNRDGLNREAKKMGMQLK